ncbi:MAG TPA: MFS transporter, partial [Thermoanaerobaculia bacterium]|nr:MFS transporter [Thermoanaerobaculia bacterium]
AAALLALASPRVPREAAGAIPPATHGARLGRWRLALLAAALLLAFLAHRSGWQGLWLTLAVIAGTLAVASFLSPEMLRWAWRWEMLPVLAFVVLYKVGDSALGRMVKPFWVDRGMSPTEIGIVSSSVGMGLTIAGALAAGWFIQKRGIFAGLLWLGIAQLVSNFGYVAVAALDLPRGDMSLLGLSFGPFQTALYCASAIESVCQGLGTAAFLSFLMNLCDRAHAATQYALLSAAFALSRDAAGALSGIGVEAFGYAPYFTLTALLALPGLALLPWIRGAIRES